MSKDELTALMGMDGATCFYVVDKAVRVRFRRLVSVPEERSEQDWRVEPQLDGEGSRKWSGALAATKPEVSAVISVSQDGPIFVFEADGTEERVVRRRVLDP